jgi:hypothetical protein
MFVIARPEMGSFLHKFLHTDAISNAIDFTNFFSRSPHAVIRVYDLGGSNFPPQRFAEHTVREITFLEYKFANSV